MDKNTNKIDERLDILSSILESDEKMIVYLYLGFHTKEKLSLDQIAKFMGTSREPVRKRLNKAIEKLQKNPNVKKYFEDYL